MSDEDEGGGGGYGKPPKSGQFKPGQSGNPAGRPRKKRGEALSGYSTGLTPIDRLILEEAERLVRVREGDQLFELSQQQALLRAAYAKAIKGSPMAMQIVIAENLRVQALDMQRRQQRWDSFKSYVNGWREAAARAEEQGKPATDRLPHPDDIEFADDLTVNVLGPTNAEELKPYLAIADFRDLFSAMFIYAVRRGRHSEDGSPDQVDPWSFASTIFNLRLPPSLRLSSEDVERRTMTLMAMRLPKLEEHIADLCSRVGWRLKLALHLARHTGTSQLRVFGLERVRGRIVKERGLSRAKLLERAWADVPLEHLSAETLALLEKSGLAGPPQWMAKAWTAVAASGGRGSTTRDGRN